MCPRCPVICCCCATIPAPCLVSACPPPFHYQPCWTHTILPPFSLDLSIAHLPKHSLWTHPILPFPPLFLHWADFMRTFLPHQKQQQQHQQSLKRASSSTSSESGLGDELSIMENPPKASRPSSGIIDLTAESDEEAEEQNGAGDEDDEVVEVRGTPREVPFLDISQDD